MRTTIRLLELLSRQGWLLRLDMRKKIFHPLTNNVVTSASANKQLRHFENFECLLMNNLGL